MGQIKKSLDPASVIKAMIRTPPPVALLTTALVVVSMLFAFQWAPHTFDWVGYEIIYNRDGAWLARDNRDFAFVSLIRAANRIFGYDGYTTFRAFLGAGFLAFFAWLTFNIPRQQLKRLQVPAVVALVVAVFLLKATIQVREGIAFGLVVMGLVALFRARPLWVAIALMMAGCAFHMGIAVFLFLLVMAALLARFSPRAVDNDHVVLWLPAGMRTLMLLGGLLFGGSVVVVLTQLGDLSFLLSDLRVYVSEGEGSNPYFKIIYWMINAVMVFIVCREMIFASQILPLRPTAAAYIQIVSRLILPSILLICILMVALDLLPFAIAFFARLFFTTMGMALMSLTLVGRLNPWTLMVTAWVLIDSIRLYAGALRPF